MQDQRMMNPRKQKSQRVMISQVPVDYKRGVHEGPLAFPLKGAPKSSKKSTKNDVPPIYLQQQERSKSSAQVESSVVGNEYRALRRKYLMLEEESCNLGNELRAVEDEIKTLEEAKLQLLDQLVLLEGLVDPSESRIQ